MNKHLLIVEDDELVQSLLAAYMQSEGFKVSLATTGKEMLACIDSEAIDLVLLDLGLPDETGMEILQKLKSEKALQQMKVVVFSGSKSTKNMSKAKELGAEWYFVKPDNPSDLRYIAQELVAISTR